MLYSRASLIIPNGFSVIKIKRNNQKNDVHVVIQMVFLVVKIVKERMMMIQVMIPMKIPMMIPLIIHHLNQIPILKMVHQMVHLKLFFLAIH